MISDAKAKWARGRRLVVTTPALYEGEAVHEMSATSAGCGCKELLKALMCKDLGLVFDFKEDFPRSSGVSNPCIVLGDRPIKWCPFCRGSLRLRDAKYDIRTGLP